MIALFHNERVFHQDLNAHNILLTPKEEIFLIDFDKCCFKKSSPSRGWPRANLDRLKRSLGKLNQQPGNFHFDDENWRQLEEGYQRKRG
ncbi:MAG: lipopolysaccharide kinase InaA family protein [Gammaproteobacteria bacterium]|nr:lipopolysaccharide kinase InaA family protein [Gammaproteobacteria bacterium]